MEQIGFFEESFESTVTSFLHGNPVLQPCISLTFVENFLDVDDDIL